MLAEILEGSVNKAVDGRFVTEATVIEPFENILFAHSDGQMASGVESAIWEGKKGASLAEDIFCKSKRKKEGLIFVCLRE